MHIVVQSLSALSLAAALVGPATTLGAQSEVTVGTESRNVSTCQPFTCHFGQSRYQQVYDASYFERPFLIRYITFQRWAPDDMSLLVIPGTYTLRLSKTTQLVRALSLDFAQNITSPQQLFTTVVNPTANGGLVTFEGTPFLYDPRDGNLLLDFEFDLGPGAGYLGGGSLAVTQTGSSWVANRDMPQAPELTGPYGNGLYAPLTTFATAVVPEPSTYALLGTGLLVIGGVAARRRRQTV
jgi:hypothetical protein